LGLNFNWRSHSNQFPNLVNLFVRHRYASSGPISLCVQRTQPAESLAETMNFNFASRIYSKFFRALAIRGIWIGNVQGQMEFALRVFPIDCVTPLRRFVIADAFFPTNRVCT